MSEGKSTNRPDSEHPQSPTPREVVRKEQKNTSDGPMKGGAAKEGETGQPHPKRD